MRQPIGVRETWLKFSQLRLLWRDQRVVRLIVSQTHHPGFLSSPESDLPSRLLVTCESNIRRSLTHDKNINHHHVLMCRLFAIARLLASLTFPNVVSFASDPSCTAPSCRFTVSVEGPARCSFVYRPHVDRRCLHFFQRSHVHTFMMPQTRAVGTGHSNVVAVPEQRHQSPP